MSSLLYNSAALSALQALNMTQQSLNTVQNQVSTGLAVATAADNSSYWSVAAELNQNNGVVTAANTALTEGQSMLSTANSAINSVITTLNSMATALTEAQTPNANLTAINTSLASLGPELIDAVNNASFNGLNMLNGTVTTTVGATALPGVNFVSGYNATPNGGTVNTIGMATQTVYGAATTAATSAPDNGTLTLAQATTLTLTSRPGHRRAQRVRDRRCDGVPVGPDPRDADSHKDAPFSDNADPPTSSTRPSSTTATARSRKRPTLRSTQAGSRLGEAPPTSPRSRPRAASPPLRCRPRLIRRWEPRRVS